jgi:hypothetical protein
VLRVNAPLWALALTLTTPAVAAPSHHDALILVACHAGERNPIARHDPPVSGGFSTAGRSSALLSGTEQDAASSVADCVRHSAAAMAASGVPEHAAAPDASTFGGDPVSWRDILQMLPAEATRYKDVTLTELNGLKRKCITVLPRSATPKGEKLYDRTVPC